MSSTPTTDPEHQGFSDQWLSLREPSDHAARSVALTARLAQWASTQAPLQISDLGAGTGSNLRYLCPYLGHDQQWLLIDNDSRLLAQLPRRLSAWAEENEIRLTANSTTIVLDHPNFRATIRWQCCDLATQLNSLQLTASHLLTGSALLDLTSTRWLEQLSHTCAVESCACLFVLNYDGRIQWHDNDADDLIIQNLLNSHQLSNKGFGLAMGPQAGNYFSRLMTNLQQVIVERSDWQLGIDQLALQQALINGWAQAALEQDAQQQPLIQRWLKKRLDACERQPKQQNLLVGHTDVLSLPATRQN